MKPRTIAEPIEGGWLRLHEMPTGDRIEAVREGGTDALALGPGETAALLRLLERATGRAQSLIDVSMDRVRESQDSVEMSARTEQRCRQAIREARARGVTP